MKRLNISPEDQSEQLWETYVTKKPQEFWLQYEQLLLHARKSMHLAEKKAHKITQNSSKRSKNVFHPHFIYIQQQFIKAFIIMLIFTGPFLGIVIVGELKTLATAFFAALILFSNLVILYLVFLSVISFKIQEEHLIVRNHFIFKRKVIPLYNIKSVHIKPLKSIIPGNEYISHYDLIITLNNHYQYAFRYRFSLRQHQAFFAALKTKVTQVNSEKYPGYPLPE